MVDLGSDFREEKETEKQKSQRGREKESKNNIEKIFRWTEKKKKKSSIIDVGCTIKKCVKIDKVNVWVAKC